MFRSGGPVLQVGRVVVPLLLCAACGTGGGPLSSVDRDASLATTFAPADRQEASRQQGVAEFAGSIGSTAVIAIQDGRLLCELGDTSKRTSCHSVRKSLVNALYGIAVDRGLIDVHRTLGELGLDDEPPLTGMERSARLVDLLTARSGIYHDSVKDDSGDIRHPRDTHPPDTYFYYNNWSFNALGGMFERLTDLSLGQAFFDWIATPIGMSDFRVEDVRYQSGDESVYDSWRFWISARDLARFGALYLNEGMWGETRILSREWIERTMVPASRSRGWGYGYLWWILEDGSWMATGTGGQKLLIDPSRRLVVVNRVDTGEGLSRAWWWKHGKRVKHSQFIELVQRIVATESSEP